jgi:diguanylate cyclase (GGDEF)-like protein/PAS domain S-box-containing protein
MLSPDADRPMDGHALFAAVPIAVLITDSNGICIDANPAALNLLGLGYGAVVGNNISTLLGQKVELQLTSQPQDADNIKVDVLRIFPPTAEELTVECSASMLRLNGRPAVVYFLRDITDELGLEQQLRELALKDPLTGLPNRHAIEKQIELALRHIARGAPPAVLCFLDLDNFKEVNDSRGHVAGDAFLRLFSGLIRERARATDAIGRVGGDEFVVLLNGCALSNAKNYVEQLRKRLLCLDFNWDGRSFKVSLSAGLTLLTPKTPSVASALSEADIACLEAKSAGRGKTRVFSGQRYRDTTSINADADILDTIKAVLASGAVPLSEQPLRNLQSSGRSNVISEVLLRIKDIEGQLIPPTRFLAVASRHGLAPELDRLIIRRVLDLLVRLGPSRRRQRFFVNITTASILDDRFPKWLEDNVPAALAPFFGIEIKESNVLVHPEPTRRLIAAVCSTGSSASVDHVSGGVEGLSSIIELPVTLLKLHPGFSKMTAAEDMAYVEAEALVRIAHRASLLVAITNIETRQTLRCVEQLGADFAQGVAVSPALPLIHAPPVTASDIVQLHKTSHSVRAKAANI